MLDLPGQFLDQFLLSRFPRLSSSLKHVLHVQPPQTACRSEVGRRYSGTGVRHSGHPPSAFTFLLMLQFSRAMIAKVEVIDPTSTASILLPTADERRSSIFAKTLVHCTFCIEWLSTKKASPIVDEGSCHFSFVAELRFFARYSFLAEYSSQPNELSRRTIPPFLHRAHLYLY